MQFLWLRWTLVARRIVAVQTTIILMLVYFTVMVPLSFVLTFAVDALGRKARRRTMWKRKEKASMTLADMQVQY